MGRAAVEVSGGAVQQETLRGGWRGTRRERVGQCCAGRLGSWTSASAWGGDAEAVSGGPGWLLRGQKGVRGKVVTFPSEKGT